MCNNKVSVENGVLNVRTLEGQLEVGSTYAGVLSSSTYRY